jgi:apolipoprotein N-acyltransferase
MATAVDAAVPKPSPPNAVLLAAAVISSAAMFFWGTGLHPLWWLDWFAPVPVLLMAPRLSAGQSFLIAAIAWFAGAWNMWHYLRLVELPIALVLASFILPACVFGLSAMAFRYFLRRGDPWRAVLIFPAIWVSYEYIAEMSSPHSTFGNLGYTQMNFLPIVQIASLTGIWGISFCLFLFAGALAMSLSPETKSGNRARVPQYVAIFLIAVLVYSFWWLRSGPARQHVVEVALMGTGSGHHFPEDDSATLALLRSYLEKIDTGAAQGAGVIVLPEKIGVVSDQGTAAVDALFQATAARAHAFIVVGVDRGTQTQRANEARVYSPAGTLAGVYDKHHLIPRIEDVDKPGSGRTVFDQPSGIWGVEVCKDMDFPRLSRQYGHDGVGLLLVPAWDFVIDGWLHGRMAILRGVESGFSIARAAKQGRLTLTDDRGRVLAEQNGETAFSASVVADVPVSHDVTLYDLWGNWFAWLVLAALAAMLLTAFRRRGAQNA